VTGGLLLFAQLEVLGALDDKLLLRLTVLALEAQGHLLGGLGLLVQNRLGLPAVPLLLSVITPLALLGLVVWGEGAKEKEVMSFICSSSFSGPPADSSQNQHRKKSTQPLLSAILPLQERLRRSSARALSTLMLFSFPTVRSPSKQTQDKRNTLARLSSKTMGTASPNSIDAHDQ